MHFLTSCFSSPFPPTDLCTLAGKCTALRRYRLSSDGRDRLLDALPAISSGARDPSHSLPRARPAAAAGSTQLAFVRSHTRVNQRAGIRARCQLDVPVSPSGGLKSPVSTLPSVSASLETPWPEGDDRMAAAQSSLLSSRPMVPPCPTPSRHPLVSGQTHGGSDTHPMGTCPVLK